jgi:hypothetical protein
MQATTKGTWFGFGQVKIGIVALGIAGALAIGAVAVTTLGNEGSSAIESQAAVNTLVDESAHQRFIEDNTLLPLTAAATSDASAQQRFMEQNTVLPGYSGSASVRTTAQMQFIEDNVLLPGAAAEVLSAAEIRLRDQNLLPGDDQPILPPYSVNGATDY